MMDSQLWQKLILAVAVVVVLVLAILAAWSLLGSDSTPEPSPPGTSSETEKPVTNPAAPRQTDLREGPVSFQDGDLAFTVSCQESSTEDLTYSVVITNQGTQTNDFAIEVRLSDSGGASVSGVATIAGLTPSEQREIAVSSERQIVPPATCSIIGVETDQRVIRVN